MKLAHSLELHSASFEQLKKLMQQRREQFGRETHNFERFEEELHALVTAVEGELVAEELSRYDLNAQGIKVEGKVHHVRILLSETYLCTAGLVIVAAICIV